MNGYDLITSIQPYLDENGLIKPALDDSDSGNGILYTSVFVVLMKDLGPSLLDKDWYVPAITNCFKVPGLLMRTPKNEFGLESWDDYLGVAVACIILDETEVPRQILSYGLKHGGFYNNLDKFDWGAWLGRFPMVWILMTCAAYPWFKRILKPFVSSKTSLTYKDSNGTQLDWMVAKGLESLGLTQVTEQSLIIDAFNAYYSSSMPFAIAANQLYSSKETK